MQRGTNQAAGEPKKYERNNNKKINEGTSALCDKLSY